MSRSSLESSRPESTEVMLGFGLPILQGAAGVEILAVAGSLDCELLDVEDKFGVQRSRTWNSTGF